MKTTLSIICGIISLLSPCQAGQGAFSLKGDKIYLVPVEGFGKLFIIDTATHQSKSVSLGKNLTAANIDSVAVSPQGEILFAAAGALWKWKEGDKEAQKIASFEEGFRVIDISCCHGNQSAPEGTIFALIDQEDSNDSSLIALMPGKKKFTSVFCRRNSPFSAPQTDATGRMFLASNCDLWEASFVPEEENDPELERAGTITGSRIAPLALMNTDIANSGAMVVRGVASCGNTVYATTNGRHMGAVIQIQAPEKALYSKEDDSEHPDLQASITLMKNALASAKILYDGSPCDALCTFHSTKDSKENLVFWRQDLEGDRAWMLQKGITPALKIGSDPQP